MEFMVRPQPFGIRSGTPSEGAFGRYMSTIGAGNGSIEFNTRVVRCDEQTFEDEDEDEAGRLDCPSDGVVQV
ncbi:hypothetical protein GQ457_04G037190 [Hibiscus cannabinus]